MAGNESDSADKAAGLGGCALLLVLLFLLAKCVFGGGGNTVPSSVPTEASSANRVDAPYLASDFNLKEAHDMEGSGDGFREIILMKHSECYQSITARRTADHEYEVICSDKGSGTLTFTKFMVDTQTGDSIRN